MTQHTSHRTDSTPPGRGHTDALLSYDQVAEWVGLSTRSVRRLVDEGRMPAPLRLGGTRRFRSTDIDRWIAAGCPAIDQPEAPRK